MYDAFNRKINYLRISLTDRCNLRCSYCMPPGHVSRMDTKSILSPDEIEEAVKTCANYGITKIRLTGGEPLLRKDIIEIVERLKSIPAIEEIGMTTNGIYLPQYAHALKKAGLARVNISLDTLNAEKFKSINRGNLADVFAGIEAALEAELTPVKINFVRIKGVNEEDAKQVAGFCKSKGLQIRFIRQMNLETGEFYPVEGGEGGNCSICNRLRLTADGFLKPCLHSDFGFSIRELGIEEALTKALGKKPERGMGSASHHFFNIGG